MQIILSYGRICLTFCKCFFIKQIFILWRLIELEEKESWMKRNEGERSRKTHKEFISLTCIILSEFHELGMRLQKITFLIKWSFKS